MFHPQHTLVERGNKALSDVPAVYQERMTVLFTGVLGAGVGNGKACETLRCMVMTSMCSDGVVCIKGQFQAPSSSFTLSSSSHHHRSVPLLSFNQSSITNLPTVPKSRTHQTSKQNEVLSYHSCRPGSIRRWKLWSKCSSCSKRCRHCGKSGTCA